MIALQNVSSGLKNGSEYSNKNIGITYLPVMKIRMELDKPIPKPPKTFLKEIRDTDAEYKWDLPASFSWNRYKDVHEHHPDLPFPIIMDVQNQGVCNSCYAWSTAMCLSDKVAILTRKNPKLGPSYLLSCTQSKYCNSPYALGCNTGYIEEAAVLMSENGGATSNSCWNYSWCCYSTDLNELNKNIQAQIPFDTYKNKCVNSTEPIQVYKILKDSIIREYFTSNIKLHIMDHGPVPLYMSLYQDFADGSRVSASSPKPWAETGGIYVHLTVYDYNGEIKTPAGDTIPYKYGTPQEMNKYQGAHAMSIIGWGVDKVKNFLPYAYPGKAEIDLPYWIIRNTWGVEWADNGYAKIAIPNYFSYINTSIGIDRADPTFRNYGGVTSFKADRDSIPAKDLIHDGRGSSIVDSESDMLYTSDTSDASDEQGVLKVEKVAPLSNMIRLLIFIFIILAMLVLLYTLYKFKSIVKPV